jgi:hypothetical protein
MSGNVVHIHERGALSALAHNLLKSGQSPDFQGLLASQKTFLLLWISLVDQQLRAFNAHTSKNAQHSRRKKYIVDWCHQLQGPFVPWTVFPFVFASGTRDPVPLMGWTHGPIQKPPFGLLPGIAITKERGCGDPDDTSKDNVLGALNTETDANHPLYRTGPRKVVG